MTVSISVREEEIKKFDEIVREYKIQHRWTPKKKRLSFPNIDEWDRFQNIKSMEMD